MARDPYQYFRIEAAELVDGLAQGLLALEHHADADLVARLLRAAHTLKGAARIVKHRELADLAHRLEGELEPLRDAPVTQRHDAALALVDRMTAQLATLAPVPAAVPAAAAAPAAATAPAAAVELTALPRADTTAIDEALGGLAQVHAAIARLRATTDPASIAAQLDRVDRELREVRRDVERVRLAAAAALFTPLERTARDAAIASGKRVGFTGTGGDVRVDAEVLVAIQGALVQLVRNAVVHGIESPAGRALAGKPPGGTVAVRVTSLGRHIAITVEDDGGGLDVDAIRRAADQRGLAPGGDSSSAAVFELLLRGGLSTSPTVTELAGRGIGLDLVRAAVRDLGGEISARSEPGAGTAVTLVVPVSMTAVTVLTVEIADRIAALPRTAVRRVTRVRPGDLVRRGTATSLAVDGETMPCAALSVLLGAPAAHGRAAVVVDAGDGPAAITVDRVLGIDDAVVRSLPAHAPVDAIVWGIAVDAEGTPYPVLDARALVGAARRAPDTATERPARKIRALVVDDSLTTRMLEQSILEAAGFAVAVAISAEHALEVLGRQAFDVILVDVEMPGMNGFEMITELRSRPALARIPAILVTSRDAAEDRLRGAAVGAQGYIIKSEFDQVVLVDMIQRVVPA